MKRTAIALCAALALSLTGCASVWKTMGVATEKSVAERNEQTDAKLSELKKSVDDLSTKVAAAQDVAADVARIRRLIDDLQDKIDKIPQDTLKKLAEVLDKAAAELEAPPPKN